MGNLILSFKYDSIDTNLIKSTAVETTENNNQFPFMEISWNSIVTKRHMEICYVP